MIDQRTLEKYEKDAKEAGRDSWYLSWALDTNAEERAKVRHSFYTFWKQDNCGYLRTGYNYASGQTLTSYTCTFSLDDCRVKLSSADVLTSRLMSAVIPFWMPLDTRPMFLA